MNKKSVSVVIPCFNNQDVLASTVEKISQAIGFETDSETEYELILIDDGSTDKTWARIIELSTSSIHRLKAIKLVRNVGAYQAILAGFVASKGDAVVVMAADGDDPPTLIPILVKKWLDEGVELVQANRINHSGKVLGGSFYRILRSIGLKNIPEGGSDLILVCKDALNRSISHGWLPGNTLIQLFQSVRSVSTIPYEKNRTRRSSWTLIKKIHLFTETIYFSFGKRNPEQAEYYYEIETLIDR